MKLFEDFEVVKFPEENLLFVTNSSYLYYIYDIEAQYWKKQRRAGNDHISVANYPDVSRDELATAMGGVFPTKETEFMRFCRPSQLCIGDMMDLFKEDFTDYMSDYTIYHAVHRLLLESDVCHKSYEALQKLLNNAKANQQNNDNVRVQIEELSFRIIGRDIFERKIEIMDGRYGSSYFGIVPVRIIDYTNTDETDNVAEMGSSAISVEEDNVAQYLTPFLYNYFDGELEANKRRIEGYGIDDNGNEYEVAVNGFEWYLTHNFFTFASMEKVLDAILDTVVALSEGRENQFTTELKINRGTSTNTEVNLVLDFYRRFLYRMEYMMKVGKEKGYDLISVMGP